MTDKVMLTLDREEVEALREAVRWALGNADFCASQSVRASTLGADKLRAALTQPSPQSFTVYVCPDCGDQMEKGETCGTATGEVEAVPIQTYTVPPPPPTSESFTLYRYAGSQAWQVAGEDFKPGKRTEVIEAYTVPPESYSLEEIRERLGSDEAKRAAATVWDRAHAEKMARFMQSVRPGEAAQPMENSDIANAALEAAQHAAFPTSSSSPLGGER
jgi:hypothetical protein